ncbi:protein phosphatase 1A-like [Lampetra fluviatilis]
MGAFLDKPKMEKHTDRGAGNGLKYALSSMQGWRVEMEDAHTATVGLPYGLDHWSFFAVYDGHAGSRVATYCSQHLLDHITCNADFRGDSVEVTGPGGKKPQTDNRKNEEDDDDEEEDGENELAGNNAEPKTKSPAGPDLGPASGPAPSDELSVSSVKTGIRTGFLQIDERMRAFSELRNGTDRSGSTAVALLASPRRLYFINCGDSRGVLSRGGRVHLSTEDHKPCNPREKERIQNAGGSVMIQRVNGSLAVSRALGDFDYKCVDGKGPTEQLVSPEPEVYALERDGALDEFVVLACDGVWDVVGNEELCALVRSRLLLTDDLEAVCNHVLDTCLYKGSRDNMSVVLVTFPGAPKPCPEAIKREAELDAYLEAKVEEILEKHGMEGMPDLLYVMRTMATEPIPNLPPGGGLASKRGVIEAAYNRLNPYKEEELGPVDMDDTW